MQKTNLCLSSDITFLVMYYPEAKESLLNILSWRINKLKYLFVAYNSINFCASCYSVCIPVIIFVVASTIQTIISLTIITVSLSNNSKDILLFTISISPLVPFTSTGNSNFSSIYNQNKKSG